MFADDIFGIYEKRPVNSIQAFSKWLNKHKITRMISSSPSQINGLHSPEKFYSNRKWSCSIAWTFPVFEISPKHTEHYYFENKKSILQKSYSNISKKYYFNKKTIAL